MDANKILSSDLLDIVFEGRNKDYGAYDLRKTYRQRLGKSLVIMCGVLLLLAGANFLSGFIKPDAAPMIISGTVTLAKVEPPAPEKKVEPVVIKPAVPKGVKAPEFKMKMFTAQMQIVKNPPDDEKPPEMKELDNVKIGTANINDGKDFDNTVTAPPGQDKGILNAPAKGDDGDSRFIVDERESEYPGGMKAWVRFLERNLYNNLPQDAVDEGVQGSVVLRFVVDVDGTVSDITAISGPKEYYATAIAAIRKSGKWEPAHQNGRKVKSYKMQTITIKLPE